MFQNSRVHTFWAQKERKVLKELKAEPVDGESKKIQIKLATTCNKNEQQRDGKNNAEL